MNVYCLRGDSLQRNNTAGSSVGGAERYLENTCADWSKTGQEPYGEWCARIQGADVGCARHRSAERRSVIAVATFKEHPHTQVHACEMKSLLHNVSVTLHCWFVLGGKRGGQSRRPCCFNQTVNHNSETCCLPCDQCYCNRGSYSENWGKLLYLLKKKRLYRNWHPLLNLQV